MRPSPFTADVFAIRGWDSLQLRAAACSEISSHAMQNCLADEFLGHCDGTPGFLAAFYA